MELQRHMFIIKIFSELLSLLQGQPSALVDSSLNKIPKKLWGFLPHPTSLFPELILHKAWNKIQDSINILGLLTSLQVL